MRLCASKIHVRRFDIGESGLRYREAVSKERRRRRHAAKTMSASGYISDVAALFVADNHGNTGSYADSCYHEHHFHGVAHFAW
jgi:hypothetical protein